MAFKPNYRQQRSERERPWHPVLPDAALALEPVERLEPLERAAGGRRLPAGADLAVGRPHLVRRAARDVEDERAIGAAVSSADGG